MSLLSGNRPEGVEKCLKKSLTDLNLSYVDLYLIHVPFGFPESESGPLRHPNGDLVLDMTTDHVAVWRVRIFVIIINSNEFFYIESVKFQ